MCATEPLKPLFNRRLLAEALGEITPSLMRSRAGSPPAGPPAPPSGSSGATMAVALASRIRRLGRPIIHHEVATRLLVGDGVLLHIIKVGALECRAFTHALAICYVFPDI